MKTQERVDPALWRLGGVLILGAVLSILDSTIVTVGIGSIAHDLGTPLTTAQWVASAYLLAASAAIPLTGWLSDRFGGRAVWLSAVGLFTAGTLLCGFAWSAPALIAFRVLHGLGGGLMQPVGQAVFARAAGPALGRMIGVITLPATVAPVLGPMLGGVLVSGFGWRWMFFGVVPLGIATFVLAKRLLPHEPRDGGGVVPGPLDVRGLLLLSPGLGAFVYGLSDGVAWAIAAGIALLVAYGVHALRAKAPLLDLKLFADKGFAIASGSTFLLGASLYSSMLLLPLYYQQTQHASPLEAGLLLAPQALGSAVVMLYGGRLLERFGARALMLSGIGLSILGTIAFTQHLDGVVPTLSLLVRGAGLGATTTPGMTVLYGSLEKAKIARAASAVNVLNRIGGSLGTALLVAVLNGELGHAAAPAAFGTTFTWALGLSVLSFVPAAFFPKGARK